MALLRARKSPYLCKVTREGPDAVEAEVIAYPELGPEAIRKVKVDNFPCIVINDMYGGDLYAEGKQRYQIPE